jgi:hypothetical protein
MVLLVLAPLVVAIVAFVHIATSHLFARPVRRWAEVTVYAPLAALLMYLWGAAHLFALDFRELCVMQYHGYDPAYDKVTYFPLSMKCNEFSDVVPIYVNPTIFALLAATLLSAVQAIRTSRALRQNSTRPHKEL